MRHRRRMPIYVLLAALITLQSPVALSAQSPAKDHSALGLAVVAAPGRPFIEKIAAQHRINFDLLVTNSGPSAYRLVTIRLKVYDHTGGLEIERELNENGRPPALDMVGDRLLKPNGIMDIYQPFDSFPAEIDAARMHFDLLFMEQNRPAPPVVLDADASVSLDVAPRPYTAAAYCVPLQGLILVHDGHDYYSHHRRYSLVKRFEADPSSAVSANLYAYDFVAVAPDGALFRGDPIQKESWLTYGTPIFAPASGTVITAVSDVPENTFAANGDAEIPPVAEAKDPMGFGNHITLRHADGRVSWLLHMQPGSVQVKAGDRVSAGQFIGKVGFSGDALFPHLHFNVTDGARYPSQGVPVYFSTFVRVLGKRRLDIAYGQPDTGDLVKMSMRACRNE